MKIPLLSTALFSFVILVTYTSCCGQINELLDEATLEYVAELEANDLIYDRFRNRLYATIPAEADEQVRNSIAVICPESLALLGTTFVGNEPNKLAISDDGGRVYVGLDEDRAVRYWCPDSDLLGPLIPLTTVNQGNQPAVAMDIAAVSQSKNLFVVSLDNLSSSFSGGLAVYDGETRIGTSMNVSFINRADSLISVNPSTLVSNNSSTSGLDLWHFDGQDLFLVDSIEQLFFGNGPFAIEGNGQTGVTTRGDAFNSSNLAGQGSFSVGGGVEFIPSENATYIYQNRELYLFDNNTFLLFDSQPLGDSAPFQAQVLTTAGVGRLAVRSTNGFPGPGPIAMISNLPRCAYADGTLIGDVNLDCVVDLADVAPFVDLVIDNLFQLEADTNEDGNVNLLDVEPMAQLIADQSGN